MQQPGEGPLAHLFGQDRTHLGIGVAGMDDQWQTGFARRRDMGAERTFLLAARAVLVIEVEAGLAEADHLGMIGQRDQSVAVDGFLGRRLVGMDADAAPDIGIALGHGAHALELADLGADGQHQPDSGRAGAGQGAIEIGREIGKIEVAVGVDQHGAPFCRVYPSGSIPVRAAQPCPLVRRTK